MSPTPSRDLAVPAAARSRPQVQASTHARIDARIHARIHAGIRVPQRARSGGYTLIEVVVAFGLLAAALAMLLGAQTQASRQVADADRAGRAAMYARSLLDDAGVGQSLVEGRRDGEFEDGRYRWEAVVQPYIDPVPNTQPQNPGQIIGAPRLLQIRLTVSWGKGSPRERLQLDALRLVTPSGDLGTVEPPRQ